MATSRCNLLDIDEPKKNKKQVEQVYTISREKKEPCKDEQKRITFSRFYNQTFFIFLF